MPCSGCGEPVNVIETDEAAEAVSDDVEAQE